MPFLSEIPLALFVLEDAIQVLSERLLFLRLAFRQFLFSHLNASAFTTARKILPLG